MHASDLEPLNCLERYAFALTCIERLCRSWHVSGPFIQELIDVHWTLPGKRVLHDGRKGYDWWAETSDAVPRTPNDLAARLWPISLLADQVQSLHQAFRELRRLPAEDMYCMPESYKSMAHALNITGILIRWGVELPPPEPFRKEGYPPGEFSYGSARYSRSDFHSG